MKIPQPLFKKGLVLLYAFLFGSAHILFAQTTVTISPGSNWSDVMLYSANANTNYATTGHFAATAWTSSGAASYKRSLLKFNLSSIPEGATIQSATLYLYSDPTVTSSSAWNGNSQMSGSNAVYFEKVTSNWSETSVTWNNQPATTTSGRIWFPPSTSTTENIQVDIKSFVQSWVNTPSTNYGLRMRLEYEAYYRSRTYASENHSNTSIHPKLVITYSTSFGDPVADQLDYMFAELDKTQVPTGFLEEYGGALLPLDIFNGALTDSNRVNMDVWRMAYASLQSSRINGLNPLPNLASANTTIKNTLNSTSAIPVAMVYSRYSYIREDAFNNNLLKFENEQVKDVPDRTQSPYSQRNFFIASPVKNHSKDGAVSLVFKNELFYNTSGKSVQSLSIDFADGRGYVTASWNSPVSASYSSNGLKLIKIKVKFTDNTLIQCYSQIEIKSVTGTTTTLAYPETDFHARTPFERNANHSGGDIFIAYGNNNDGTISKPLIIVEGFDASTISEDLAEAYNYEDLIDDITVPGFNFNDELDLAGYDLIFLNYRDGTDDIRRNAALFEEVVEWVNSHKVNGAVDNVVMGISMGGLVARYGLAKMTKEGKDTQTRLLITHDSPHRGANVPLGFQHLFTLIPNIVIRGNQLFNISEELQGAVELFDAPATEQMLIIRSEDGQAVQNTFLDNIYRPMVTFGPNHPEPSYEFIATSQGAECGNQLFLPHSELARGAGSFYISPIPWIYRSGLNGTTIINALPAQNVSNRRITYLNLTYTLRLFWVLNTQVPVYTKSINAPSYTLAWDGAPGGTFLLDGGEAEGQIRWGEFLNLEGNSNLTGEFSFVPTVSALDISEISTAALSAAYVHGVSPEYTTSTNNFISQERIGSNTFNIRHTAFTARNAEWLFNEMENIGGNSLNCSTTCSPEITIGSTSNSACTNSTTFLSVPDLGDNVHYDWTVGSGLQIVSGLGTNRIGVEATSSTGTTSNVNLSITTPGGCTFTAPVKSLTLGGSQLDGTYTSMEGQFILYGLNYAPADRIFVDMTTAGTEWSWRLVSGFASWSASGSHMRFDLPPGGEVTFEVTANVSPCGLTTRRFTFVESGGSGLKMYSVYPNPASNDLTISQEETSDESFTKSSGRDIVEAEGEEDEFTVALYNKNGEKIITGKSNKRKLILNVNKLRSDLYYLHIQQGKDVTWRQVMVKKN